MTRPLAALTKGRKLLVTLTVPSQLMFIMVWYWDSEHHSASANAATPALFTTAHSSVQHRHRPRSVGFHHRPQLCSTQAQTKVSGLSPSPTDLLNTVTDQGQRAFTTAHSSVQHRHRPTSVGFHHRPQLCSTQSQTKVSALSPPPTALFNTDQSQRSLGFHHRPQLC